MATLTLLEDISIASEYFLDRIEVLESLASPLSSKYRFWGAYEESAGRAIDWQMRNVSCEPDSTNAPMSSSTAVSVSGTVGVGGATCKNTAQKIEGEKNMNNHNFFDFS